MPPKLQTFSRFPVTVHVDGVELAGSVKRLTLAELDAFMREMAAPRGTDGADSVADRAAHNEASRTFSRGSLEAYFTLDAGEYTHDGDAVTSGGQFYDLFCTRQDDDVIPQILAAILLENRLSDEQKKSYRQLFASRYGSPTEPLPTTPGSAPDSTADSAAPSASVDHAAATGTFAHASSGMTTPQDALTC